MIKTLKTFNFRPFPNLGILQFSIFPKYPKFFANALEAKSQGPTKRQRREPLPAVRRLVSPTEWPWSMHLADLGYGRTGKSRVVETWEDETIGLHSVTHVQKNHRTTATPVQVAERSPRGSGNSTRSAKPCSMPTLQIPRRTKGCGRWDHGAMLLGPNCGSSLELNWVTAL